jgi:hypothetical protein
LRASPQVYLNLRGVASGPNRPPHWAQLRGTYRAAWTANLMRFANARELLGPLRERAINHRMLKGAAICALRDSWGARWMGDIDVLVDSSRTVEIAAILETLRWQPQYGDREGAALRAGQVEPGAWIGIGAQVVDLHIHSAHRSDLFGVMLRQPPDIVGTQGADVPIPGPELMLIHAARHGALAAARADRFQSLLDVGVLSPHVSAKRLGHLASRTGERAPLLDALEAIAPHSYTVRRLLAELTGRTPAQYLRDCAWVGRRRAGDLSRITELPTTLARRRVPGPDLARSRNLAGGHPRLYSSWLRWGQLRPIERWVVRTLGGFLPMPAGLLDAHAVVTYESDVEGATGTGITVGPVPTTDIRVRLRLRTYSGPVRLTIGYTPPHGEYRQLFIDGRMHGGLPIAAGESGTYIVTPSRCGLELSLRRVSHRGAPDDWGRLAIHYAPTVLKPDG